MKNNIAGAQEWPVLTQDKLVRPLVSIVIPVYNEESFLPVAVPDICTGLYDAGLPFELILCENGSTDGTVRVATSLAQEFDHIRVLSANFADYGRAMRAGMIASHAPYVVVFDIDYYSVDFLDKALKLLQKSDIVIASKLAPEAEDRRGAFRKLVTRSFSLVLRTVFNTKVRETHGMKAFKRDRVAPIIERTRLAKDLFDTELIIRAERDGLLINEVPVVVEEKRPTRSSMLKRIPRTLAGLALLRYYLWKEHFAR